MTRSLLIGRIFYGFGDWIMTTAVIKMINAYRPDVSVDFIIRGWRHYDLHTLPSVCGARVRLVKEADVKPSNYTWCCPHLVYSPLYMRDQADIYGYHLEEQMVWALNKTCPGLNLPYDPMIVARPLVPYPVPVPETPYIVVPSAGNAIKQIKERCTPTSKPKEWDGFSELAERLAAHYPLVQVGSQVDPKLAVCTYDYRDVSYPTLSYLFLNARCVIAPENGLSHWAGHHGVRCYTLYLSSKHARPAHAIYPRQIPIESINTPLSVDTVYGTIMKMERFFDRKMSADTPPDKIDQWMVRRPPSGRVHVL